MRHPWQQNQRTWLCGSLATHQSKNVYFDSRKEALAVFVSPAPLSPAPPAKERHRVLCCLPRLFTAKPEPSPEGRLLGPRKATFQNDNKSTPRFHSVDRPRSALDQYYLLSRSFSISEVRLS